MSDDQHVTVRRTVEVSVRAANGKTYKLKSQDGGVMIVPPFRTGPIAVADLRRALTELEAAAGA